MFFSSFSFFSSSSLPSCHLRFNDSHHIHSPLFQNIVSTCILCNNHPTTPISSLKKPLLNLTFGRLALDSRQTLPWLICMSLARAGCAGHLFVTILAMWCLSRASIKGQVRFPQTYIHTHTRTHWRGTKHPPVSLGLTPPG